MTFTACRITAPWIKDSALLRQLPDTMASADFSLPLGQETSHGKHDFFLNIPQDLPPPVTVDFQVSAFNAALPPE
jgi:hypothetical protein